MEWRFDWLCRAKKGAKSYPCNCAPRPTSRVSGIEDLREKREELNRSILRDEEEKAKIQKVGSFRSTTAECEPRNQGRRITARAETPTKPHVYTCCYSPAGAQLVD